MLSDVGPSPRITASCASPLISLPTASLGPAVCSTVSWTLALLELSVRLNAAISSASANPEGPTATLSTVGLDQCSQAAPANPPVMSTAATTTNQRQVLLMRTSRPAVASQRSRDFISSSPKRASRTIRRAQGLLLDQSGHASHRVEAA